MTAIGRRMCRAACTAAHTGKGEDPNLLGVEEAHMGRGIGMSDPAEPSGLSSIIQLMERYRSAYHVAGTACGLPSFNSSAGTEKRAQKPG
jgi:hypothetical protein